MKRFTAILLVTFNIQCMDSAQKKEIDCQDAVLSLEIPQLIENEPYPTTMG